MKLSVAATFLAQSLAAASSTNENGSMVLAAESDRNYRGGDSLEERVRAALSLAMPKRHDEESQDCDIFSMDTESGLNSCQDGSFCSRKDYADLGGECSESPRILDRLARNKGKLLTGRLSTLKNMVENYTLRAAPVTLHATQPAAAHFDSQEAT